ncbi:type VI secretion system membrane subunit TssM [Mesorhizobium sp. PL10]
MLASVLLWFFGGAVTVGGTSPFEMLAWRIYVIAGLFIAFFLITFLRHVLARRANAKLINSMIANDELVSMGNDLSADEVELIREGFKQTLKTLRDNPLGGGKGRNYLFELPWYVIIGPTGTGKTTILRNSGLDFPLAADGQVASQGIGGTRDCDWWISNEAVLIDTAGRYTTQDVNQGIDAAVWGGFLGLLKQHRRRRPLNGILLAISIADIALASETERIRQAAVLRQRLRELHRTFEMRLPVYVLFTKCDLIAGFEEYFDATEETEREQVWGVTFPYDDEQMTFGPLFETGFMDLVARIERQLPAKLAAERNNGRRCRIYCFPHEFASLGTELRGFVSDVFRVNRYEAHPLLRGVYFTSGTQEGTPFDRLLGAMSRSISLAPSQHLPMSGQDKAYFIKKLLTDIVFAEQSLVGRSTKFERRMRAMYVGGYVAVAMAALGLSAHWLHGLNNAEVTVAQASVAADKLQARLGDADRNRQLASILPALKAAQELERKVTTDNWWLTGFLSVDPKPDLSPAADAAYRNILRNYLLPSITSRLATQLQLMSSAVDTNNPLLRDQLATYLMLTTGENYDEGKIKQAFREIADAAFPFSAEDRQAMVGHMDQLAGLLPAASTSDRLIIQRARNRLNEVPQATDIYQRMIVDAERRYQLAPISISSILATSVLRVDTSARGGTNVVPGLYTKAGFYEFFLLHLPEYIRSSTSTDWVLGKDLSNTGYDQLAKKVVDLYVHDYIAVWRGAINQVRIVDFETLGRGQTVLQELSSPQSPLTRLLTTLRDNTELPLPSANGDDAATAGQGASAAGAPALAGIADAAMASATDALAKTAISTALGDAPWPGTTIGAEFKPLTSLVDPQGTHGSFDKVQQLFADLLGDVSGVATAPQPDAAAFDFIAERAKNPSNDNSAKLRAEAATTPEPVRSMVDFVVDRNWQLMMALSYKHMNALWQQDVVPVCNATLAGRYPFAPGADEDVSLQDFADLFKPAGIIDKFFADNIAPFVSTRGKQLTPLFLRGISIGFSDESLAQFSRAQTIRDAFFGPAGTAPEAKFTVEPTFLGPKALKSSFTLDDVAMVYRHGPVRAQDFVWPSKVDASVAQLEMTLLDGTSQSLQRTGAWSIFRMLNSLGLSKARGQDQFVFSMGKGGSKASYLLKASSVINPFNLGLYSSFRCPPALGARSKKSVILRR